MSANFHPLVYIIDYIHTYIDEGKRSVCALEEEVRIPNPFADKNYKAHYLLGYYYKESIPILMHR